jgi:TRAP-type C4-dicarboxylate transport system permease small subunit
MMKRKSILDWFLDIMGFMAGVLLVAAVLIVCFEIFMRYFVHRPQVWTVEVCEYILFSMAFLGAPWLLKQGGHVNIDIFVVQFSPRPKRAIDLITASIGIIISAIICWFSITTSYDCYISGVLLTKTMNVPKHYFLMLIALGYFFLLLEFARQFIGKLRNLKEES